MNTHTIDHTAGTRHLRVTSFATEGLRKVLRAILYQPEDDKHFFRVDLSTAERTALEMLLASLETMA